jgi:hypothetical protein
MAYKRPIPSRNAPASLNRKRPQFFPRLNIRLRPSRFPGVLSDLIYEASIISATAVTLQNDCADFTESLRMFYWVFSTSP